MTKIKIVTDSTVDLDEEIIQKYNIHVIPLTIYIDGETFLDRINITPSKFMEKMRNSKELPKSSQPSIGSFVELYNQLGADGSEILSIHMTSQMSGTFQTASAAANQCEAKVTVIDSKYISKALAFQVIEAAQMVQAGKSVAEIVEHLDEVRSNSRLFVVVDTLENLVKGGRIGRGKALVGSLLNIKPIATLDTGEYTPVAKVRSYSQVVKYLVKEFTEDVKDRTVKGIGLVHADGIGLATKLKEKLLEVYENLEIYIEETTPIVSTHTGPGAIGFMYYTD